MLRRGDSVKIASRQIAVISIFGSQFEAEGDSRAFKEATTGPNGEREFSTSVLGMNGSVKAT